MADWIDQCIAMGSRNEGSELFRASAGPRGPKMAVVLHPTRAPEDYVVLIVGDATGLHREQRTLRRDGVDWHVAQLIYRQEKITGKPWHITLDKIGVGAVLDEAAAYEKGGSRNKEWSFSPDGAHHMRKGGQDYVDTGFMNRMRQVNPQWDLTHMGFGEFYLADFGEGRVDFAREDQWGSGHQIPGASGRTHRFYDNKDGKFTRKIIRAMEKAGASTRVSGRTPKGRKNTDLPAHRDRWLIDPDTGTITSWDHVGNPRSGDDYYAINVAGKTIRSRGKWTHPSHTHEEAEEALYLSQPPVGLTDQVVKAGRYGFKINSVKPFRLVLIDFGVPWRKGMKSFYYHQRRGTGGSYFVDGLEGRRLFDAVQAAPNRAAVGQILEAAWGKVTAPGRAWAAARSSGSPNARRSGRRN